jgi:hypothetical protein
MHDDLYARFDRFRLDSGDRPAADPGALRAAAERGSRVRAWSGAAVVAVAVLAVGAAVAVAGPPPVTPVPNASVTGAPTAAPTSPELTPSPERPPVAPSTPSTPPFCAARDLKVATYGGDGHAGGGVNGLGLTNTGAVTCTLHGAFEVAFVDAKGRRLPTDALYTDNARSVLTLRPGETGYFSAATGHVPAADETGAPCDPPAAGLRITPRGSGESLTLRGTWRACGHGRIEIGPLMPRPDPNWHD